jgi:hypothetical protein
MSFDKEERDTMQCPSYGFENPEGLKVGIECGISLKRRCGQCGFENASQAEFCGGYGMPLTRQGVSDPCQSWGRNTRKARQTGISCRATVKETSA